MKLVIEAVFAPVLLDFRINVYWSLAGVMFYTIQDGAPDAT